MSNIPDSFIEAWVIPNHIRCITIDTNQKFIIEAIPQYKIAFTFDSIPHISIWAEYRNLENFAEKILQEATGDNQVVIEVNWRGANWELTGQVYLYGNLTNEGRIIWSGKKGTYKIPSDLGNANNLIQSIQTRGTDILS